MIRSLEGLRGTAAVMVALFHLKVGAAYFPPIRHGYLFVDLFFVLSGFVIAGAYAGRLDTLRGVWGFMLRRWGRLFPLLLVCTALFVFARNALVLFGPALDMFGVRAAAGPEKLAATWPTWAEIAATLTLTHSMGAFPRLILNFASWSISVEFWTYVLFALLCFTLPRRARVPATIAVALAAGAIAVWASTKGSRGCLTSGKCLDVTFDFGYARCVASFMLGTLVWEVRGAWRHRAAGLQGPAMVALCVLFILLDAAPGAAFLMPVLFALLIWSLADDTGPLAGILCARPAAMLGQRSYSIYLLHPVLLVVLWQVDPGARTAPGAGVMAAYLACLLWLSAWTYRFVEAPARARCNLLAARIEAIPRGTAAPAREAVGGVMSAAAAAGEGRPGE